MFIKLDGDTVSRIVLQELLDTRDHFQESLAEENPNIFSLEEVYDKILIQKHIEALNLLIEWYV